MARTDWRKRDNLEGMADRIRDAADGMAEEDDLTMVRLQARADELETLVADVLADLEDAEAEAESYAEEAAEAQQALADIEEEETVPLDAADDAFDIERVRRAIEAEELVCGPVDGVRAWQIGMAATAGRGNA